MRNWSEIRDGVGSAHLRTCARVFCRPYSLLLLAAGAACVDTAHLIAPRQSAIKAINSRSNVDSIAAAWAAVGITDLQDSIRHVRNFAGSSLAGTREVQPTSRQGVTPSFDVGDNSNWGSQITSANWAFFSNGTTGTLVGFTTYFGDSVSVKFNFSAVDNTGYQIYPDHPTDTQYDRGTPAACAAPTGSTACSRPAYMSQVGTDIGFSKPCGNVITARSSHAAWYTSSADHVSRYGFSYREAPSRQSAQDVCCPQSGGGSGGDGGPWEVSYDPSRIRAAGATSGYDDDGDPCGDDPGWGSDPGGGSGSPGDWSPAPGSGWGPGGGSGGSGGGGGEVGDDPCEIVPDGDGCPNSPIQMASLPRTRDRELAAQFAAWSLVPQHARSGYHVVLVDAWRDTATLAMVVRFPYARHSEDAIYLPRSASRDAWIAAVRALHRDRATTGRWVDSRRTIAIRTRGRREMAIGNDPPIRLSAWTREANTFSPHRVQELGASFDKMLATVTSSMWTVRSPHTGVVHVIVWPNDAVRRAGLDAVTGTFNRSSAL